MPIGIVRPCKGGRRVQDQAPGTPSGQREITNRVRVEKLLEPAACQSCGWQLEPGESAVVFRGEIFCKRACVQKAIDGPFDVDLGGEG